MGISSRALNAGAAVIKLSFLDGAVEKQLARLESKLKNFGSALSKIGTIGLSVAGSLGAAFGTAIKFASDASESVNKFNAVFGGQASAAEAFASRLATTVGRSKTQIRDSMSAYQSFFVGLGFGADQARNMSEQMASLTLDFASFHNLSDEEAASRFISALSGSSEVLDQFGVNIKQAALQQELLREGITKTWPEVSEQEKAVARLNIIMQSMTAQGAVGDAVKTAGSFANQLKALKARLTDVAVEIGTILLPTATKWLEQLRGIVAVAAEWISKNSELVVSLATTTAKVLAASIALLGISKVIAAVTIAVRALQVAILLLTAHPLVALLTVLGAIALALAAWAGWLDKIMTKLGKLTGMVPDAVDKLKELAVTTPVDEVAQAAEARREELKNRIAANRATYGNPWGITATKPTPADDPMGFAEAGDQQDAIAAAKWIGEAVGKKFAELNPLAGLAPFVADKLADLHDTFFTGNHPVNAVEAMARRPEAFLDTRLAKQSIGFATDYQREQTELQRRIERNTRRRGGGLPVV